MAYSNKQQQDELPVAVSDLSKTYRRLVRRAKSVRALNGLNIEVAAGESYGILGPNGAGKTTLIKILLGIVHPTNGRALVWGRVPGHPASLARMGYLPENHRYPDFLTAELTLRYFGMLSGLAGRQLSLKVSSLLELVRMSKWRSEKVKNMSKGMQQRVGLAQALLNSPDLLVMDEPTDGVDPLGRREIRDILLDLRQQGVTILINSHLLSEVERTCTRVGILSQGTLVYDGPLSAFSTGAASYHIALDPADTALKPQLQAQFGLSLDREGQLIVGSGDSSDLNAVIDRIRSVGARIIGVQPQRETLEDIFIKMTSGQIGGTR